MLNHIISEIDEGRDATNDYLIDFIISNASYLARNKVMVLNNQFSVLEEDG